MKKNYKEINSIDYVNVNKAYEVAYKYLQKKQIDLRSFADIYTYDTIERDLNEVNKIKKTHRDSNTDKNIQYANKLSVIIEACLCLLSDKKYFTENVSIIKTSEYDDFFNHVDAIMKIKDKTSNSYIALGIDVTIDKVPTKKIERIKRYIDKCKMFEIKYFTDENFIGCYRNIPNTVVILDYQKVIELCDLLLNKDNKEDTKYINKIINTILIILSQIYAQLIYYKEYIENKIRNEKLKVYSKNNITYRGIKLKNDSDINNYTSILEQYNKAICNIEKVLESFLIYYKNCNISSIPNILKSISSINSLGNIGKTIAQVFNDN